MEPRLIPINAILALYSPTRTSWPRPFFDANYQILGLEFPVPLDDGSTVVPDATGFNRSANRFVTHEGKSGANVDEEQARRYMLVDANLLVRTLSVSITSLDDVAMQVNYVCLREHEKRVLLGLNSAGVEVPIISVGEGDIRAVGAPFGDPVLAAAFSTPLPIPGPPPGVITIHDESSDEDFDAVVFPSLVAAASSNEVAVTLAALTESSIPHYAIYPAPYRLKLKKSIGAAARRAADADPERWEYRGRNEVDSEVVIRVLASPESVDPRGRTQQYQSMRSRLATGPRRRIRKEVPGQGSLFDETDLEEELNRAGSVNADDDDRKDDS